MRWCDGLPSDLAPSKADPAKNVRLADIELGRPFGHGTQLRLCR
jgi:hypothetical protein